MNIRQFGKLIVATVFALLIDDSVISARVKAALVKDPIVSVESFKGALQLSGFVETAHRRVRAVKIADDVPGVTHVFNSIQPR